MPRANGHFLPGHVWHLTHRGHERDFLLKFARDRNNYLRWLYEARKQRRALPFACFVRTDEPLNPVMSRGRQKARPDPITHEPSRNGWAVAKRAKKPFTERTRTAQ